MDYTLHTLFVFQFTQSEAPTVSWTRMTRVHDAAVISGAHVNLAVTNTHTFKVRHGWIFLSACYSSSWSYSLSPLGC